MERTVSDMANILVLGGTSEASQLAKALAAQGARATFSYAGRTSQPVSQPLPTRIGGFGGVEGLSAYMRAHNITHLVDATHPFATQMSLNARAAASETGIAYCVFERPAWQAGAGDRWISVPDYDQAIAALGGAPKRVFLAIGKQNIGAFAAAPQHHYILRLVDAPLARLPLASHEVIIARGPFDKAGDQALLETHGVTHIIAKNAGGTGAVAKLEAARALGLPVIMLERPALPPRPILHDLAAVLDFLGHAPLPMA